MHQSAVLEFRIEWEGGWASRQTDRQADRQTARHKQPDRQTGREGRKQVLHNLKGVISIAALNFAQLRECERMFSIVLFHIHILTGIGWVL